MTIERLEFEVNQQINYSTASGSKSFTVEGKHLVEDKSASTVSYVIYKGYILASKNASKEQSFIIDYRGSEKQVVIDLRKLILDKINGTPNVTLLFNGEVAENARIYIPSGSRLYCTTMLPVTAKVKSIIQNGSNFIETYIPVVGIFTIAQKKVADRVVAHLPATPVASTSAAASSALVSSGAPESKNTPLMKAQMPLSLVIPAHHVRALTPPDGTCMFYAVTLAVIARFWACDINNNQHVTKLEQVCRQLFDGQNEFILSRDAVLTIPAILKQHNGTRDFNTLVKRNDATFQSLVENNLRKRLFRYMNENAESLAANKELQDQLRPLEIDAEWIKASSQEISRPNEWGELPQLFALSQMVKTPIIVFRGPNVSAQIMPKNSIVFGKEYNVEPIRLFFTGDHYDFYIHTSHIPNYENAERIKKEEAEKKLKSEQKKLVELSSGIFFNPSKPKIKSKEQIEAEKEQEKKNRLERSMAFEAKKRQFQEEEKKRAAQPQLNSLRPKPTLAIPSYVPVLTQAISAPHDTILARQRGISNLESWLQIQQGEATSSSLRAIRPRDYQLHVIKQFIAERSKNLAARANALIVLPTGTGKTGVMSMLSGNSGEKHVILAPWVDVVTQTQQAVRQFASLGLRIAGVKDIEWTKEEIAERRRLEKKFKEVKQSMTKEDALKTQEYHDKHNYSKYARFRKYKELIDQNDIIVASNQFMYQKKVYKHFPWKQIDSVSFDEVHHIVAPESKEMLLYLRDKEQKEIIGYTATPSEELYELFGFEKDGSNNPIHSLTMMQAIDKKALAPLQFVLLMLEKDKENDNVNLKSKEITDVQVERKLNQPGYTNAIINYCLNTVSQRNQKPLRDMTTLISCAGINHVKVIYRTINELVTIDQIDAQHIARELYADKILMVDLKTKKELITRAKLTLDPNQLTLTQAQQIANMTFKTVASLYIATNKEDDEKNVDMMLDKKIFEMGGIRFMVTCGKLGEGYSLSRIEHIVVARMPTSKTLISQLGGRVTRLDLENVDKIGHITQVSTSDAIDRIVLYAEQHLTKDGKVHFCYPSDAVDQMSDEPQPPLKFNVSPIMIPNPQAPTTIHWNEPDSSKKMWIKRMERLKKRSEQKKNINQHSALKKEKTGVLATIGELKKLLDELKLLFKKVEHMEIDESSHCSATHQPIVNAQEEKSEEMLIPILQPKVSSGRHTNAIGDGLVTRSRHSFLIRAEETLISMGNFLNPLYQAISLGSDWTEACRSARKTHKVEIKSEELMLAELSATAKDLLRKIFRLRRANYIYSEDYVMDECDEEQLVNDIDQPNKLEKCINLLKDTLEKEKEPIIKAINQLKAEAKANSQKKLAVKLPVSSKRAEKADKGWIRDYLNKTKEICKDLDPNDDLSIFAILKKLAGGEGNEISWQNYTGVMIDKLNRHPSQWNSIDPETRETVLHWVIKIGIRLQSNLGELHANRSLLTDAFNKIDLELLGHRDNNNQIPIQLLSEKKRFARGVTTQIIMGYAQRNFDFKQHELNESDFQLNLPRGISSYYFSVRNKNYNSKENPIEGKTVLHYLYLFPRYLIDELLQKPDLDFTIKDKYDRTPLSVLLNQFDSGPCGKQLVTIITILKNYPAVLSANEDIYHTMLEKIVLSNKTDFPYELIVEHFPRLDSKNEKNESLETILINGLKKAFTEQLTVRINDNLFKTLKLKKLSEKARDDIAAMFKYVLSAKFLELQKKLEMIQRDPRLHLPPNSYFFQRFNNYLKLYKQFLSIFELDNDLSFDDKIKELYGCKKTDDNNQLSTESSGSEVVRDYKKRKIAMEVAIPDEPALNDEDMQDTSNYLGVLSSPIVNPASLGTPDGLIHCPEIFPPWQNSDGLLSGSVPSGFEEQDDEEMQDAHIAQEQSEMGCSSDNQGSSDEQDADDLEEDDESEEAEYNAPVSCKRKREEEIISEHDKNTPENDKDESENDYSSEDDLNDEQEIENVAHQDDNNSMKDSDDHASTLHSNILYSHLAAHSRLFQSASAHRVSDHSAAAASNSMK